jgi:hypothetical protein
MVSFLTGLGGGYIQATDKRRDQERQDKQDAWMNEQRDRQRSEWAEKDKLNTGLRDAAAPRSVMEGTVTEGGGNKYLNADPAQASAMQQMLAAEAEMTGGAAPTQQAGRGVVGMTKGNQITTGPADAASLNTPDAVNTRIAGVYRQNGQADKALSMENSIIDQQAKRLGLDVAQAKFADEKFNRSMVEKLAGDFKAGAADILTTANSSGLAGATVAAVPKGDGKTFDLVATRDGKTRVLATYEDSDAGKAKFMKDVGRISLTDKIGYIVDDAKAAKEQDRWQQTHDLSKKKGENDEQYRSRVLGMQQEQNNRARAVHAIAMEDAKIPQAVKLQATSLAKQIEAVGSALNKAMAEGMFDPNNPGTQKLLDQQAALGIRYRETLEPYTPGAKANADPLGLRGGATATPATPAAAPVATPMPGDKSTPMQAATAMPAAQPPATGPRAAADQADAAANAAMETLRSYGSRQQMADPQGFAAARKAVEQTQAQAQATQREYEASLPSDAFRAVTAR